MSPILSKGDKQIGKSHLSCEPITGKSKTTNRMAHHYRQYCYYEIELIMPIWALF
jgi:hypothetical protein